MHALALNDNIYYSVIGTYLGMDGDDATVYVHVPKVPT